MMRHQPEPIMLNSALPADTQKQQSDPLLLPIAGGGSFLQIHLPHKHPNPGGIVHLHIQF